MKQILIIMFLLVLTSVYATIINIPADYPSIQLGIYYSVNTDTVLVQPGTYVENINYYGKLVTVASLFLTTQDSSYISSTIIDGNSSGSVVTFDSGENSSAVLCGFTIKNGYASGGGGIRCGSGSPSLENVTISGNSANSYGGGIYLSNSSPILHNVTITNNSANYGGGICCGYGSPSLENVTISGNSANSYGGGIFSDYSNPSLQNVTITGNSAAHEGGGICFKHAQNMTLEDVTITNNSATSNGSLGGGIYCYSASPSLENVTIAGNSADRGGGICFWGNSNGTLVNVTITGNSASGYNSQGGGIYAPSPYPVLLNSILWNNSPQEIYGSVYATYSDIQGGFTGTGNINADPLFADPGNGDYHLTWANYPIPDATKSTCIDAGNPHHDYDDPDFTRNDMGAYYYHQPSPPDANFYANPTNGYAPFMVNFNDSSFPGSDPIDEWLWDFGEGNNSSLEDPSNEYYYRGSYTVSLTVTNAIDLTDTETKVDYITVLNSTPIVQNSITDFSFDEDTSNSSIDLNNVFDDADLPYGDILSFSYSGNTFIDVSIVSGIVTLTPDPDWFGFEDITFTATDDSLESVDDEVRVTIDPVNDVPVINSYYPSYSPVTIDETESQLFWVSAGDIDGDVLSFQWYVDDVPQTGQIDSTYTYITDYTSAGTYMIKCIVDDGVAERTFNFYRVDKENNINMDLGDNRATDYQEWQLIVNDVDQQIVVNNIQPTPGPITIDEMDTISFLIDAYDPDGNPLDYSWKLDGVEESTTSTYDFITDYTSAGNYLVTLNVTDNFTDNSLYYEWNVTVNDIDQNIVVNDIQPPPGSVTIDEGETINFFIDAYDPDGNPLEYSWELDGVEISTNNTYTFETDYTSAGEYVVTLEVTDNFGTRRISGMSRNTLNYSWDVTVNDVDQAIVVDELIPPEGDIIIDEGDVINFSIDAYDPDGNPLEYSWELNGVEVSTISVYDFTTDYTSAGNYFVTLDVTDNFSDNLLYYEWSVTVNDVDQDIIVNDIQPTPGPVTIDEMDTINFLIDAYDPDGNPLEYSWELDGVEVSTNNTYTFETDYTSAGEYLVTLEVTDNFGTRRISDMSRNTLNYSWDVTVNDVDQAIVVDELIPPEGDIIIDEGDVINFSIDAYDPDGNDLEYSWQVEGEEVSVESTFDFITDENSAGEYEVTLYVTDNFSARDELNFLWNITVNDVSGSGEITIPNITKLYQNHPNPFNPETNIHFDIKESESGILTIFNMKGQIVVTRSFNSGRHKYLWNAQNCSSGVYFYKLQTETIIETRKMLLLK